MAASVMSAATMVGAGTVVPTAFASPPPPTPVPGPTTPVPGPATSLPPAPPPGKGTVVVDVDTGHVLGGVAPRTPLPPASLTKTLTALVAVGWLAPGTSVAVSPRAAAVAPDKVGMKAGQTWTFDSTLQSLLVASANDAAFALAEQVSGSVESFATLMTGAGAVMGMSDGPVLRDPAGLDGAEGVGGGNLLSPRDLAIAGRDLMAQPQLAALVLRPRLAFTGPDGVVYGYANHNRAFLHAYPGATGVKTGYTDRAGPCLIASATRSGRTMLAVVLSSPNPVATASALLDQGFATPVDAEPTADTLPPVRLPTPALVAAAPSPTATRAPSAGHGPEQASAVKAPFPPVGPGLATGDPGAHRGAALGAGRQAVGGLSGATAFLVVSVGALVAVAVRRRRRSLAPVARHRKIR